MANKRVLVLLANGFEETEYIAVRDLLIRMNLDVDSVTITESKEVRANHNLIIHADYFFNEIRTDDYDALFIPGGAIGVENLDKSPIFEEVFTDFAATDRVMAAICAAPTLFAKRGILEGVKAVVYPETQFISILKLHGADYQSDLDMVEDGRFFTGKNMIISVEFGKQLAKFILNKK